MKCEEPDKMGARFMASMNHTQCGVEEAHTESTGCPLWYND